MARITFRSISNNPYSLLYSKYIVTEMRWTPEDDTVRHNEVKIGIVNHFQHSWGHEGFNCSDVAAYVSSLVFQSLQLPFTCPLRMCFRRPFLGKVWPVQLTFLFFFTFLTRSVRLTSICLEQHISKLARYFWSTFRSVQVSAQHKAQFQMQHFTVFFLKS
jgi:hypothetical protein